ncbi:hypothetical protein DFQ14_1135 [Halopolyspora algeriensis]|uniref:Transporter n=1 Tax=Halopolyspora algeriensis TaxID=1500506 RepID=A0A368VHU8_9ACTN|nr:hypothetical protein [Halopolyspora algeriensis]RCW39924.1 hypothetical protein DFQ14_1135 [Halopolyspora algeriensis]TQM46639.1 hypothetical protein FHU43_3757 [Halopolyspora algeriensis]
MNEHREPDTGTGTPSPAEMLAITEQQQRHTERELDANPGLLFGAWGLAWLLGFGELFLTIGRDPIVTLPLWAALTIFFGCLGTAGTITAWHLTRAMRGVRGPSQTAGAMYGWSWTLGFIALGAMIGATAQLGISYEVHALLWTAGSGLLVGVLFLSGGAMTGDWWQYGIGLWTLLINAVGAFAGIPGHYLVMSLAGGGGFLVAGIILSLRPAKHHTAAPEVRS